MADHEGCTPVEWLEYEGGHDVENWLYSYLSIRWNRAGRLILLRALVDQGRARLMNTSISFIVGRKRKLETHSEVDMMALMDFLFRTSPEGIFAAIMLYL